jgi:hypothetical protein
MVLLAQSGDLAMTAKSKLALIATIVAVSVASPAFAQSFDPDVGSGNIVSSDRAPTRGYNMHTQHLYDQVQTPMNSIGYGSSVWPAGQSTDGLGNAGH